VKPLLVGTLLILAVGCGLPDSNLDQSHVPEIRWASMDSLWAPPSKPDRRVLVNVYTEWCDYCRQMDNQVYPDSTVRRVVAEHFITVGLNADSDQIIRFKGQEFTERAFARRLGVRSYPTMVFMDPDGHVILQTNGFMPTDDFIRMLTYIGSQAYDRVDFAEFKPEP
jgi:thioredoxin-related protein